MKIRHILFSLAAFAWIATGPVSASEGDFVVIVHPSVDIDWLDQQTLSRFMLGRKKAWDDGTLVRPVDLPEEDPIRSSLNERVHRKEGYQLRAYWQRLIFSGRGEPPPVVRSEAAVVEYVRTTPGALGYVGSSADPQGVKLVRLLDSP